MPNRALTLTCLVLAGCVGTIDDAPQPTPQACTASTLPTLGVRRLTRTEYRNSVADLFGVEPPEPTALPEDAVLRSFTTTTGQAITAAAAGKYFDVADAINVQIAAKGPAITCTSDEVACVRNYLTTTGTRIARRPLTEGEVAHYLGLFSNARRDDDFNASVGVMLTAMLSSPQFLFVSTVNTGDSSHLYGIAAHLSYSLWRTTPDAELLSLAANGALASPDIVQQQIDRLLADARAQAPVRTFVDEWLQLGALDKVNVKEAHPEATPEVVAALAAETRAFVDDAIFEKRDLRQLFVSSTRFRNRLLSQYYGDNLATSDTIAPYTAAPTEQAFGLLSQAGLLMAAGHNEYAAIIYRGKYVRIRLLCDEVPPPPAALVTAPPSTNPYPTSRERIANHTAGEVCQSCHTLLNPIGFTLGHFDGSGRWQDTENGAAIDTAANVDPLGELDGALSLSRALADSDDARACVASTVLTMARSQRVRNEDDCLVGRLAEQFAASGYDVSRLVAAVVFEQAMALNEKAQ